jgi:hypothetical protein
MTKKFKDFGSGDLHKEPITFAIHGENFECRPAVQGKILLKIVADADSEDGVIVASAIDQFFKATLLSESYERFEKLLVDEDKIVTVETLGEITAWLMGEYADRPTQGPDRS